MAIRELLQYVQDAYAALTQLSMIIVDDDGNPVTKVSNLTELAELVLFVAQKEGTTFFCPRELSIESWQRPILAPVGCLGMKSILAPIFVEGKAEYWVWSGVLIEEETKWLVREQSMVDDKWAAVIAQAAVLPAGAVEAKLRDIERMAAICGELIRGERCKQRYHAYGKPLEAALADHPLAYDAGRLLARLQELDPRLDVALYIERRPQACVVVAANGEKAERLKGRTIDPLFPPLVAWDGPFHPIYFQEAALDPRFSFFVRHDIRPKMLIAYPAVYEQTLEGWAIVASETALSPAEELLPLGHMLVQHWLLLTRCAEASAKTDRHLMRLSMLMEIGRAMRVVQNEEEIVRMMVEFAVELAYGEFVCAVWCCDDRTTVIHEGALTASAASGYREEVRRRYGRGEKAKNQAPTLVPIGDKTVMEVPFFVRDRHYGVLAVHIRQPAEAKEAEVYIAALAAIGALMMQGAVYQDDEGIIDIDMLSEQLTAREMDVLELLIQGCSNREISERLFISVHTVKNHITNIFQKIGVNDRSQLIALVYQLNHRRRR
ncbi:helix-turn-helix transcriptional regulator [Geobacillus icigianus]|uniref:HTH-type transcriptional regulator MalT n=1 Tax=Geobacillus icigianus TaxID=1430331 RepID=A0ABU6BJN6_9BACL|nr:helix-turn-helix transcriptional regulator [Geobacillus icigianus]MEB3752010.1 HTH-type transcriptional regulator MalT [Geobacillus icigianus]